MTTIIDENGYLFKRVNIIDLTAALLVLAVIIAGATLITGHSIQGTTTTASLEYQTHADTAVAQALTTGMTTTHGITIESVTTEPYYFGKDTLVIKTTAPVVVESTAPARVHLDTGDRLVIGDTYTLDFGTIVIEDAQLTRLELPEADQ